MGDDSEIVPNGPLPPAATPPSRSAEERALVVRARRGDSAAFEQLVSGLLPVAYHMAFRLVGDREDAAEIVQESLVHAYVGIGRFAGRSSFRTWLLRVVHNAAMDVLRHRQRHPQVSLAGASSGELGREDLLDPAPGPQDRLESGWERDRLAEALRSLEPEFRSVVVLRDVHGLDYEEIARIVGVPRGTVKSRLHRGRARLRAYLQQVWEPLEPADVPYSGDAKSSVRQEQTTRRGMRP